MNDFWVGVFVFVGTISFFLYYYLRKKRQMEPGATILIGLIFTAFLSSAGVLARFSAMKHYVGARDVVECLIFGAAALIDFMLFVFNLTERFGYEPWE